MTALFLVVLVLAWLVVFLPSTRARNRAPLASTQRFKRDLETIALPNHSLALAMSFGNRRGLNVRVARLALFLFMCACVVVTFAGLFLRGSSVLDAQLLADAALMLYVSWLIEEKKKNPRRSPRVTRGDVAPVRIQTAEPEWWDVRVLDEDSPSGPITRSEGTEVAELEDDLLLGVDTEVDEERVTQLA